MFYVASAYLHSPLPFKCIPGGPGIKGGRHGIPGCLSCGDPKESYLNRVTVSRLEEAFVRTPHTDH